MSWWTRRRDRITGDAAGALGSGLLGPLGIGIAGLAETAAGPEETPLDEAVTASEAADREIRNLEMSRAVERYNRSQSVSHRQVDREAMSRLSGYRYEVGSDGTGRVVTDSRYRNADGSVIVDNRQQRDQAALGDSGQLQDPDSNMGIESAISANRNNVQENAALGTNSAVAQQTDMMVGVSEVALMGQGEAVGNFGRNQEVAGQAAQASMRQRQQTAERRTGQRELVSGLLGFGASQLGNLGGGSANQGSTGSTTQRNTGLIF